MKTTKINNALEYLSTLLVLSYFLIHSILIVLIGIVLSLYLINYNSIKKFIIFLNDNLVFLNSSPESSQKNKEVNSISINIKSDKEDSSLTLVEKIEELGFIPSIEEDNDTEAA